MDCVRYIEAVYYLFANICISYVNRPNLITLMGFGFILINYFLAGYMIPDLSSEAPSWVYFVMAINVWLYSTFDNVDGKQARRTKSSSPLGELFDHGCDAISTLVCISLSMRACTYF